MTQIENLLCQILQYALEVKTMPVISVRGRKLTQEVIGACYRGLNAEDISKVSGKSVRKLFRRLQNEIRIVNTTIDLCNRANSMIESDIDSFVAYCRDDRTSVHMDMHHNGGFITLTFDATKLSAKNAADDIFDDRMGRTITAGFSTNGWLANHYPTTIHPLALGILTRGGLPRLDNLDK